MVIVLTNNKDMVANVGATANVVDASSENYKLKWLGGHKTQSDGFYPKDRFRPLTGGDKVLVSFECDIQYPANLDGEVIVAYDTIFGTTKLMRMPANAKFHVLTPKVVVSNRVTDQHGATGLVLHIDNGNAFILGSNGIHYVRSVNSLKVV
jgi:hypothetical protein